MVERAMRRRSRRAVGCHGGHALAASEAIAAGESLRPSPFISAGVCETGHACHQLPVDPLPPLSYGDQGGLMWYVTPRVFKANGLLW